MTEKDDSQIDRVAPADFGGEEKTRMDLFASATRDLLEARDDEAGSAALEAMAQIARQVDLKAMLNAVHVPDDAGEYEQGLRRIMARIPDGWGRWISCQRGWWPLLIETDRKIAELLPDYEIHQVKEKYGTLRFYWSPSFTPFEDLNPTPQVFALEDKELPYSDRRTTPEYEEWKAAREEFYARPEVIAAGEEISRRADLAEVIANAAEERSAYICERCGSEDNVALIDPGWMRTSCPACAAGCTPEPPFHWVSHYQGSKSWRSWLTKEDARALIAEIEASRPDVALLSLALPGRRPHSGSGIGREFVEEIFSWVKDQKWEGSRAWGLPPMQCRVQISGRDNFEGRWLIVEVASEAGLEDRLDDSRW